MGDLQTELIPARGVNAFVFCPRLFWLEYVVGEFADNEHTVEGRSVHKRVDKPGGEMAAPEGEEEAAWQTRSLWLSDADIGVTAKLDLVDVTESGEVFPVDTKKGRAPDEGLWAPDRVQLTLQALLLRANGYRVEKIAAWYHGSRKRVELMLSDALVAEATDATRDAQILRSQSAPPAPLVDSPQCRGCSLNAICLPDEVNALGRDHLTEPKPNDPTEIRRVFPARDDRLPLYVHTSGTRIGLSKPWRVYLLPIKSRIHAHYCAEMPNTAMSRISIANLSRSTDSAKAWHRQINLKHCSAWREMPPNIIGRYSVKWLGATSPHS